jgi:hypothetical protein
MDLYELRSLTGWRRHMLITLIAHLFIIKLRRRFSLKIDTPGPAPLVTGPVSLSDYSEAVSKSDKNLPIDHPNITVSPDKPQQILTIGMIVKIIRPFIPKLNQALSEVDYMLRSMVDFLWAHIKVKLRRYLTDPETTG